MFRFLILQQKSFYQKEAMILNAEEEIEYIKQAMKK